MTLTLVSIAIKLSAWSEIKRERIRLRSILRFPFHRILKYINGCHQEVKKWCWNIRLYLSATVGAKLIWIINGYDRAETDWLMKPTRACYLQLHSAVLDTYLGRVMKIWHCEHETYHNNIAGTIKTDSCSFKNTKV